MKSISHDAPLTVAEQYKSLGYYVAHELLTSAECEELKAEALRVLREKGKEGKTVFVGVAAASPKYYQLASHPRIVEVLKDLLPDSVMFWSDKFVFKSGSQRGATPWHIDEAYWKGERSKVSVWIALDDVAAENGALKVLPGSHLRDWKHDNAAIDKNGEFTSNIGKAQWDPKEEVVCEIKKGSMIFFSDKLLHASCTNEAGLDRYAIISTYHAPAPDTEMDKKYSARHVIVEKESLATAMVS